MLLLFSDNSLLLFLAGNSGVDIDDDDVNEKHLEEEYFGDIGEECIGDIGEECIGDIGEECLEETHLLSKKLIKFDTLLVDDGDIVAVVN